MKKHILNILLITVIIPTMGQRQNSVNNVSPSMGIHGKKIVPIYSKHHAVTFGFKTHALFYSMDEAVDYTRNQPDGEETGSTTAQDKAMNRIMQDGITHLLINDIFTSHIVLPHNDFYYNKRNPSGTGLNSQGQLIQDRLDRIPGEIKYYLTRFLENYDPARRLHLRLTLMSSVPLSLQLTNFNQSDGNRNDFIKDTFPDYEILLNNTQFKSGGCSTSNTI